MFPTGSIPQDPLDPRRKAIKRVMKSLQGPYDGFKNHFLLEEAIDIYMEIWYDSDSSGTD